jgi:hypothetical protein
MQVSQLRTWLQCGVAGAAWMLVAALPVAAQLSSASVAGSVRDDQGAATPGATVTLISETRGNQLVVVSNDAGEFVFPTVSASTYTLRVTMDGFKATERKGIVVAAGDKLSVGVVTIEVGAIAETITVAARATELQTQSAERSYAIEGEAVKNIAVNGRGFLPLAFLTPGVVSTDATPTGDSATMSANGGRQNSNNVQVDGITDMDTGNNGGPMVAVSLDSIQEVKILTSNYQAEYGRSSGAQISAITKSGGRDFHGSAYWFRRKDDLNANTWFNNRNTPKTPVPALNQRDLGYTVGGPVVLPGFNEEKTKVFFFFSQEYQKRLNAQTTPQRVRVPTALERQGDFSKTLDNAGNPFPYIRDYQSNLPCSASDTRGCFQDGGVLGKIPANRLYDIGLNILKMYPQANSPDTVAQGFNYVTQDPTSQPERQDLLRLDWYPSTAWRFNGKIVNNHSDRLMPYGSFVLGSNLPDYSISYLFPRRGYSFSAANTINSTTFLEVTYGYSHNSIDILPDQSSPTEFTRSTLGLSAIPTLFPDAVQLDMPPRFRFGEGGRVANPPNLGTNNAPFYNFNTTQDLSGSLTKLMGRHTAKTGLYYHHSLKPQSSFGANNGDIIFNNDAANPFDTGFSYANAAIGVYNSYQQASRYAIGNYVYNNVEWYLQDNWKVTDRLTLDYGMRFYWIQPQYDTEGQTATFLPDQFDPSQAPRLYFPAIVNGTKVGLDRTTGQTVSSVYIGRLVPNSGNTLNGVVQAGKGVEKGLYRNRGIQYGPRFGFTYDPSSNQRMIVRGGGGVFYDRAQGNTVFDLITNPPTTQLVTFNYGRLQDINPSNILLGPPNLVAFDHEGKVPTTYAFNLGVQVKLPLDSALDISYVGSQARNQLQRRNINAPAYGAAYLAQNQDPTAAASTVPGAMALQVDFLRPYQGYGDISLIEPVAKSNYNSLQMSLNRRFKDGLLLGINYTWSKALGTVSNDLPGITDVGAPRPDGNQQKANYAPLNFDRRHSFVANFVYALPRKQGGNAILRAILNDWQTSGVYRWQSGSPYTVGFTIPGISSYTLTGTQRLEGARIVMTGDPGSGNSNDPYRMFNTSAFTIPQPGGLGLDSSRNYMNRAPINNLDLSLSRSFRAGAQRKLEFRIDAFNALNHTQFLDVNSTLAVRSLTDPTPTNLPYDSTGKLVNPTGFGAATNARPARQVQLLMRFQF